MGLAGFERNSEALAAEKAKQDQTQGEFGARADMIYPLDGQTMMRVLPPYSAEGVFFKEIIKHRVQIAQDDVFLGICPEAMGIEGEDCPVCAKGEELYASKDEAQMAVAKDLKIRKNFIYNVIVFSGPPNRKSESPEKGKVYCFEGGIMIHRQIMELDQDPAAGWADITSPSAGVNLLIKRTGKGLNTKYAVNPHGGGRTDIFKYLSEEAGVDPAGLELFNLDEVYFYDAERTAAAASRIKTPRGAAPEVTFAPAPVAQPLAAAPDNAAAIAQQAPVAAPVATTIVASSPEQAAEIAQHPVVVTAAPIVAPVIPGPPKE